jgi:phosphoribosyl 1,2-cyclic phosphodiesterase
MLKVRFYGVRGSIASCGPDTVRYGGNTSCVLVEADGERLVFDAGTGIRKLGTEIGPSDAPVRLFFSHLHWDHIQGFPFFTPAFIPGNRIDIHAVRGADDAPGIRETLAAQMTPPNFPVPLDVMRADMRFIDIPVGDTVRAGRAEVRHLTVDHPNGCVAYRVDLGRQSVVYATDLEHEEGVVNADLVDFARGADLLIYDAMYTPEELHGEAGPPRKGWGHSTFDAGAAVAERAGVGNLCLFHHDPSHDDTFMDALDERAKRRLHRTLTAREGLEMTF